MKRNAQAEVPLTELEGILPDYLAQSEMENQQLGQPISEFLWREPVQSRKPA